MGRAYRWIYCLIFVSLGIHFGCPLSHAQDEAENLWPWQYADVALGWFSAEMHTSLRIDFKPLGVGTVTDLENILGLAGTANVFRFDGSYYFGPSPHQLKIGYYDLSRQAQKRVGIDLTIGGITFPLGVEIASAMDLRYWKVSYAYALLQKRELQLALGLGAHITQTAIEVREVGGGQVLDINNLTAPLPVLGLHMDLILVPKLLLRNRTEVLWLKLDKLESRILNSHLSLEYMLWKHLGLGVGYEFNYFAFRSDNYFGLVGDSFVTHATINYTGLRIYAVGYF